MDEPAMDGIEPERGVSATTPEAAMTSPNTAPIHAVAEASRVRPSSKARLKRLARFLNGFGITLALSWLAMHLLDAQKDNPIGLTHYGSSFINWGHRRDQVKQAFVTSWDAYAQHAWGEDVYHPVSQKGSHMSPQGLGWIIVDSLSTMMVMDLTGPLADSRKWLHRSLTYDQDQDVNTFETTIRMLGGLLSAHYLSTRFPDISSRRDTVYMSKAVDLAERLLSAYDSKSGIPYASVHLARRTGLPSHDGGASSMAEAGTVQLEMKYLSYLTGNETYWRKAEKVMQVLDDNMAEAGLLPIYVHPDTGRFTSREIRLGSRGDSYYEYLIKQYLQTSGQEPIYLDMWEQALAGIEKHLVMPTKHSGLKIVGELPHGIGGNLSPKMDHLVCFLPGSIALGATGGYTVAQARTMPGWTAAKERQIQLAMDLMKTCWGMYAVTATGLAPEIAWFKAADDDLKPRPGDRPARGTKDSLAAWKEDFIVKPLDAHNLQRPETVESLFMMWRITEDPLYRAWGWKIFRAFEEYTNLGDGKGYTSLNNVNALPPPKRDNMESFWLAETLKYLYLLFSPTDYLPLHEIVFNTEAHIFPRFKQNKWKTGWERKPR